MRHARLLAPPDHPWGYYHCTSRVVDGRFIFTDLEREFFRSLLHELSAFCGIRVLTFCIMSNHFHLLAAVPRLPERTPEVDETLGALEHLSIRHGSHRRLRQRLAALRAVQDLASVEVLLRQINSRRWRLSVFLQLLKQRFSYSYNRRHGRCGTLWQERFGSVLLGGGQGLLGSAAYIDLNPTRAGLVDDPKDFRWSGYGEALGGVEASRQGLRDLIRTWLNDQAVQDEEALAIYRRRLYEIGRAAVPETGTPTEVARAARAGFSEDEVQEVLNAGGRLSPLAEAGCRVRYFTEGVALGTRAFIEEVFQRNRPRFGKHRQQAAFPLQGIFADADLFTVVKLRKNSSGSTIARNHYLSPEEWRSSGESGLIPKDETPSAFTGCPPAVD